jgi:hypothetical protein
MSSVPLAQEPVLNLSALIAKVKDLPPLPSIVMKAMEMTLDPNISIRNLQQVISQDQALSAKILRIVNSAMYALRREVSTVSHAVAVLGLETVKSVIMAASAERVFNSAKDLGTKLMSDHSWGTALTARLIARRVRYENPEEALICGLMHDIGKPVGYHHNPCSAPSFRQLACVVNLANLLMISMGIGFEKNKELNLEKQPSTEFLKLNGSALVALASEVRVALQATAGLRS